MGGHQAGDLASRMIVTSLAELPARRDSTAPERDAPVPALAQPAPERELTLSAPNAATGIAS